MTTAETHRDPSFLHIIRDLRDDATTLVRQEIALVKREIAVKAEAYLENAGLFGIAGLIGLYAVFFVLFSLNSLLQTGLIAAGIPVAFSAWLAPLLTGMFLGIAALMLTLRALRSMRRKRFAPIKPPHARPQERSE